MTPPFASVAMEENMRRYSYTPRAYGVQTANIGYLVPIYYFDTVPGESFGLKLDLKMVTDSLKKVALNPTYIDVFAFYVPFRLLDSGWPDFISGLGGSLPTVANIWKHNLEGSLTGAGGTTNVAWQRYCYNYVWNEIFRSGQQAARALTDNTPAEVMIRHRSFQNTALESTQVVASEAIGTTVDSMRDAIAEQRRKRREAYFAVNGREYEELLRRAGVEVGRDIDEAPRLIGSKSLTAEFGMVVDTGGTSIGSPSGLWAGRLDMTGGMGLCPEHGLVMICATTRMDFMHNGIDTLPLCDKDALALYWTPDAQERTPKNWNGTLFGAGSGASMTHHAFEDYRTLPSQLTANLSGTNVDQYAIVGDALAINTPDELRLWDTCVDKTDFFRDFIGANHTLAMWYDLRLDRNTPVPPASTVSGA